MPSVGKIRVICSSGTTLPGIVVVEVVGGVGVVIVVGEGKTAAGRVGNGWVGARVGAAGKVAVAPGAG